MTLGLTYVQINHRTVVRDLPAGTIFNFGGMTYLWTGTDVVIINSEGWMEPTDDTTQSYVMTKIPSVIHGQFKLYYLGF